MDATLPTTEDREIGLDAEPRGAVELPGLHGSRVLGATRHQL